MKKRKKHFKKRLALVLTIWTLLAFGTGILFEKFIINKNNLNKSSTAYASSKYNYDNTENNSISPTNPTEKTNKKEENKTSNDKASEKKIETSDNKSTNSDVNTSINNKTFFNDSVFFGDSITEGMSFYEVLDESHVIAKKGLTVFKAEKELNKVINLNPKKVYILLGNNDLFEETLTSKQFVTEYTKIIKTLKQNLPKSNIHILSILPVTKKAEKENLFLNTYRINEFNNAINRMAKQLNVTYIDIKPVLNNNEQLYELDGIHLKCDFYNLLLNYLINYQK